MECGTCLNESRINALEEESRRNQQTHKEFFGKFEEFKISLALNGKDVQSVMSKLDEISRDVKEIKEKPVKRYETIVACLITAVIGGVLGFLLNGFLPM